MYLDTKSDCLSFEPIYFIPEPLMYNAQKELVKNGQKQIWTIPHF